MKLHEVLLDAIEDLAMRCCNIVEIDDKDFSQQITSYLKVCVHSFYIPHCIGVMILEAFGQESLG